MSVSGVTRGVVESLETCRAYGTLRILGHAFPVLKDGEAVVGGQLSVVSERQRQSQSPHPAKRRRNGAPVKQLSVVGEKSFQPSAVSEKSQK